MAILGLLRIGIAPAWPGQAGNPVGHTAAPGFSSLTAWPGGTGAKTISDGTNATSGSGTSGDPWIFRFYDFDATTGGILVTASNVQFIGCRFQSNSVNNYNVAVTTGTNVTFSYCSIVPRVSLWTTPPNASWPSAGALLGILSNSAGYTNTGNYCVPSTDGYQYAFSIATSAVTIDHCDVWGFGNAVNYASGSTAVMIVSNNWIHDAANCNVTPPAGSTNYHTDGPGYLNGGTPPANISVTGNTIASIGNTNGIAFQAATSGYANISVVRNFLSGFANLVDMCHNTAGSTNLSFTDNIIALDLPWLNGPLYANFATMFTQGSNPTNLWRRNTLRVPANTAQYVGGVLQSDDGKYILPDITISASDWSL